MTSLHILAFGAHPDDVEIGMAGTIAKHVEAGYRVGICDLTKAEMSSNGTVELRQQEAAQASAVLGLYTRSCLGLPDRQLAVCEAHIMPIVREIRKHKPQLVFIPYWIDRHPDHVKASELLEAALFNAKLRKYMPEIEAWDVPQVIYYYINDVDKPTIMVDVSDYWSIKEQALLAYRSQFDLTADKDSIATPLTRQYIERVKARDLLLAQQVKDCQYAEGFTTKKPYPITSFI